MDSRENDCAKGRVFEAGKREEVFTIRLVRYLDGTIRRANRTRRVSTNNRQTSELLTDRKDHDSECAFLI